MAAHYDQFGIRFLYPENWRVAEELGDIEPRSVTIESPGGALWTVMVYEPPREPGPLADEVFASMQREFDGLEGAPISEYVGPFAAVGYDMDFIFLDLIAAAQVVSFRAGARTYVLLYQAESREFEELERVFQAMAVSLVQGAEAGEA